MEYLVKMNEKLLKVLPRSFPKIKMEQTLILVTILISLVTLLIHNHIYQLDVSRGNIMKSKTDLIREKTIEMNNKLDSLELNCPENPACPVCPSCPECPACNCPEEKEKVCPDCNCPTCPTVPVVQKDTGATVQKDTGTTVPTVQKDTGNGASGAKPFRETDGVDSLENSNNLFSNFYSLFSKDEEGDVPIVNTNNSNKNTNNNSNKNTNNNSNKNTNNNSNKNTNNSNNSNKNSNILEGEMDGFEKVPGYAIVPER